MVPRLTLALLLLLAGCTAIDPGPPEQGTETVSPVRTTGTPTISETPTGVNEANTIEYTELSAIQQRAFDVATEEEARFFDESPYLEGDYFDPDVAEPFESHEYVRKNDTYYQLSSRLGNAIASYEIRADESQPNGNATITAFENLSAQSRTPVQWAIENGSYSVPSGKWNSLPDELSGANYVRYSDSYYRMSYTVGDAWVKVWTAEEVA